MEHFIMTVKIGIFWTRKAGIRHGIKTARHYHHWAPKARW